LAFAAAMISSSSLRNPICWPSVETPRSNASRPIAIFQPPPTAPISESAGQRASVKKVSLNSASPLICLIPRTSMPG
jgi:hypothetical protein